MTTELNRYDSIRELILHFKNLRTNILVEIDFLGRDIVKRYPQYFERYSTLGFFQKNCDEYTYPDNLQGYVSIGSEPWGIKYYDVNTGCVSWKPFPLEVRVDLDLWMTAIELANEAGIDYQAYAREN